LTFSTAFLGLIYDDEMNPPSVMAKPTNEHAPIFVYKKGIDMNMKDEPKAPRIDRPVVL
jgi:hypothetical protein